MWEGIADERLNNEGIEGGIGGRCVCVWTCRSQFSSSESEFSIDFRVGRISMEEAICSQLWCDVNETKSDIDGMSICANDFERQLASDANRLAAQRMCLWDFVHLILPTMANRQPTVCSEISLQAKLVGINRDWIIRRRNDFHQTSATWFQHDRISCIHLVLANRAKDIKRRTCWPRCIKKVDIVAVISRPLISAFHNSLALPNFETTLQLETFQRITAVA